jgi:hypothetical protein
MSVDTHIEQARTRVQSEQEAVSAKHDAFDAFIREVGSLSTEPSPTSSTSVTTTAGVQQRATSTSGSGCWEVRTAFAETIRPHSVDNNENKESLLETIRAEFTETIAMALAPPTEASFTRELRETVLTEAQVRRAETAALKRALDREATQLNEAGKVVDEIADWIVDTNEKPLTDLSFDTIKHLHETLASHRTQCEELARQRQKFLEKTTSDGVEAGISHRQLVPYLYEDFPIDHPVLATVTRLDSTCAECQRTVRDHLVRRT